MKLERIIEEYEATYAVFKIETANERDFFKNIYNYITKAPKDVLNYFDSSPTALLGHENDRIDMLVFSKYNFFRHARGAEPGIYPFLRHLFKEKVLAENLCEQVKNAVKEYEAIKV